MRLEETIVESAKQRSLRVPLDHYERPDALIRTKWLVSALAACLAVLYITWLLIGGRLAYHQVSPGPVASVHSGWNNDCQVCHLDFRPLRSDALPLFALSTSHASLRQSLDERCLKCHNEPEHHKAARPGDVPTCAACHQEHRGTGADIVRAPDSACLSCHRDMNGHREGPSGLTKPVANVTGFSLPRAQSEGPHPDFRSLEKDPGNVKFNHWLHLQPGIAPLNSTREKQKRLSDLDEAQQPRYKRYEIEGGFIKLDCGACHEPDDRGHSMRPIAFEQHCQACHPLQARLENVSLPLDIPHGLTADKLATVVDGLLFDTERKSGGAAQSTSDESGKEPLIPGKTLGENLAQKIGRDLLGRRSVAQRTIAAKCSQCHYDQSSTEKTTELLEAAGAQIPARWLRHARFNHNAHRHLTRQCKECHEAAYDFENPEKIQFINNPPAGVAAASDDETVMIAGLAKCAECHAPKRGDKGGARHDCSECHAYHGRDHLLSSGPELKLSALPAYSLKTRNLEPPASVEPPPAHSFHFTSLTKTESSKASYVGASTCASAGCHGDVRANPPHLRWRGAFTTWVALGPHLQAYDVLWTQRGREMTRLLAGQDAQLSDGKHFQALQRQCVGCHATPRPAGVPEKAESYALGVQCESCHGPAGSWLHTHYRDGFQRDQAVGMINGKNLDQRAGACVRCHVGPNEEAGATQVVDHDLIAAGHPRLTFEFRSYVASLPSHWDLKPEQARNQGAYQFRTWLAGQKQQVEQRKKLAADVGQADFSQLDCFACHHQLGADSWRQPAKLADLRPVATPQVLLNGTAQNDLSLPGRLKLAASLLEESKGRWDAVLHAYLAASAIVSDIQPDAGSRASQDLATVNSALANLRSFLANDCYSLASDRRREPTQYDSPTEFASEVAARHVQQVTDALKRLEASIRTP